MREIPINELIALAEKAGAAIVNIYQSGEYQQLVKDDETPVTSADYAANEILCQGLQALTPEIPILSEESCDYSLTERKKWQKYWLLDPLDGTQEFIAGSGDFAVSIALIEDDKPEFGLIYWPTKGISYFAHKGHGAYKREGEREQQIFAARKLPQRSLKMAISRRQRKEKVLAMINPELDVEVIPLGSCALKSCLIAEGKADCYLRLGPTGEWDTGACQCIVEEAGGKILDSEFNPLSYNQRDTFENPDFMVLGCADSWQGIIRPHTRS